MHTSARYGHAGVIRILVSARCNASEQNKVMMMTIMVHDDDDDEDGADINDDDIRVSGVIRILVRSRCNASEQKQKRTHITPTFHLISQRPRIILTPTSDQKNWDSPN